MRSRWDQIVSPLVLVHTHTLWVAESPNCIAIWEFLPDVAEADVMLRPDSLNIDGNVACSGEVELVDCKGVNWFEV
jgi:hypothetical protein